MKPAPMPWIGCGLGAPPLITGDAVGSTAKTRSAAAYGGPQVMLLAQASAPRKAQRGARLLRIDKPARMIDDAVRMRAFEAVARSQDSLG